MYVGAHCCSGLGVAPSTAQIVSSVGAAGGAITGAEIGTAFGPGIGTAVGSAIGVVAGLIGSLFQTSKVGLEKEAGTKVVNQAQQLWEQNLAAWNSSVKTVVNQQAAETNFNNIWSWMVQGCSACCPDTPACVGDRQRGGKFDAFVTYYDPIANDPNVQSSATSGLSTELSSTVGSSWPLLLGLGLVAVAFMWE